MFIICFNEQLDGNFHILPILVKYHYNGLHRPLKHFMFIRHYLVLVYLHFHIISRVDLLVFNNFNYQRVQITLPHQRSFFFFSSGKSIGGIKLSLFDGLHSLFEWHTCFPPPHRPYIDLLTSLLFSSSTTTTFLLFSSSSTNTTFILFSSPSTNTTFL